MQKIIRKIFLNNMLLIARTDYKLVKTIMRSVSDVNIKKLLEFHKSHGKMITMFKLYSGKIFKISTPSSVIYIHTRKTINYSFYCSKAI